MISCTCSYAQEDVTVTISMNKWKAMEESVKHLNDSITSLNKIIVSKDTLISNRGKINEQTFKKLQAVNSECTKLNVVINKMKSDSIDSSKMLGDLRSQLLSAQKQLGRVDTMTIQVIITYMNLKCSKSKINTLRKNFANIANQTIKKDYKDKIVVFISHRNYNTYLFNKIIKIKDKKGRTIYDKTKIKRIKKIKGRRFKWLGNRWYYSRRNFCRRNI